MVPSPAIRVPWLNHGTFIAGMRIAWLSQGTLMDPMRGLSQAHASPGDASAARDLSFTLFFISLPTVFAFLIAAVRKTCDERFVRRIPEGSGPNRGFPK